MGDPRDDAGEHPDPDAAGRRGLVAASREEARADREVGLVGDDGRDDGPELGRVVLAVAVEPDRELVAAFPGVAEAGLDGAADPEVEGQLDDVRAGGGGDLGGAVGRAVGDDDDLEVGIERVQLAEQAGQVLLLVVGRDDRDPADGRERPCRLRGRGHLDRFDLSRHAPSR